jgi:gliding motility-associated-like protein
VKQKYFLLSLAIFVFAISGTSRAQLVSTNIFFPGRYLEIGQNQVGAFGTSTAPAGFHPYPGPELAEVYDAGHDGWTVGSPPFMGDYTWPGSPFEGWEIQIAGVRSQAFTTTGTTSTISGGTLSGSNVSYSDVLGTLSGVWAGTAGIGGVLSVRQTSTMDTNGSQIVVTTVFKNTGSAAIPNIYYMRSCDPDNDETRSSNFATNNTIVHQNEDRVHSVEVDAEGETYHNHWSLCTKDCRAVAFIYESWPLSSSQDLGAVWSKTYGTAQYTLHGTLDGDYAIGLVYKLGSLPAHDSTVISYAYVFNDSFSSIDIAFPDPQLVVNGTAVDSVDTFTACSVPGLTSLPVSIANGSSGTWTYSTWKWSPALGLAATTGITNTVNINALSGPITYTITGSDSLAADCELDTFLLTVFPCFNISNNGPICQGDTLMLFAHGDSTGATYTWYNPAGVIFSTAQNPIITPVAVTDAGLYTAIKTVGTANDTAYTTVVINPLPAVSATTDAPICSQNLLTLTATIDSPDETFNWTGPLGFTSTSPNPTVSGSASVANSGTYKVYTALNGCIDSAYIYVEVDSTPAIPSVSSSDTLCSDSTIHLYGADATSGVGYNWTGPGGFTSFVANPVITNAQLGNAGTYTLTTTLGFCSSSNTTTVFVKQTPPVPVVPAILPLCSGATLNLSATDTIGANYVWSGPQGFTSTTENPTLVDVDTAATGVYSVYAILNGCPSIDATVAVLVDSTPAPLTVGSNSPICQYSTLSLTASTTTGGVTYFWSGPNFYSSTAQNPTIDSANTVNAGSYLVVASRGSCSDSARVGVVVDSVPIIQIIAVVNAIPICSGTNVLLESVFTPYNTGDSVKWTGPNGYTASGPDPTIDTANTTQSGTYYVTDTIHYAGIAQGCGSPTFANFVNLMVDSTPVVPNIGSNSPICQGDTLKLYSSDSTAGVTYGWTGPNLYTSNLQNPIILNTPVIDSGNYTVTVSLANPQGACTASAVTNVSVTPTPAFTPTSNSPVCSGDTLFLFGNAEATATYTWTGPYPYLFSTYVHAANPIIPNVTTESAGVYTVTAIYQGCATSEVDTVVIKQTPAPPYVSWLTYCQYYPAPQLMANDTGLIWYMYDSLTSVTYPAAPTPSTSLVGSTFYFLSQSTNGCVSALDSIQVTVNPTPTVTVTPVDTGVCPHSSFALTATDTDAITYYRWYPSMYLSDSTSAIVTVSPETNVVYSVVATNQFGCADTATSSVTVYPSALINMDDSVTLYPGESYTISPTTNCTTFSWFPSAGLSSSVIPDPVIAPILSTKYILYGETVNGCTSSDSININVSSRSLIDLPNAFTPGSGPNSSFKVIKRGEVSINYFRIFNRWGQKVFETTNLEEGWDGSFNGTPQPFGVYVYEIDALTSNGQHFIANGNVTLIR